MMVQKTYLLITIRRDSIDYDILLNYLINAILVKSLDIIAQGFLVKISYEQIIDKTKLLKMIVPLDIEDISIHDLLYEEFLVREK